MTDDEKFMKMALGLAEKGLCSATPNPRVGCVVVKDGVVVGKGWHERAGDKHAEVNALAEAGEFSTDSTVYVNLEPCNHFGRTPPCTNELIKANVKRVVYAIRDPNPNVVGRGADILREAGISVNEGVLLDDALELNRGYFFRMKNNRPLVRLKIAAGLDGKTALENGVSKWITSPEARKDVQHWRARSCAVLTGIGTLVADDPRLNVRLDEYSRQPLRVVVDSKLRASPDARIFADGGVLIATADPAENKLRKFSDHGIDVVKVNDGYGKVDLADLLNELGRRCQNEILVEAGINLHTALFRAQLVDELLVYYAPKILGSRGRGMFDLGELDSLSGAAKFDIKEFCAVGPDIRVRAVLEGNS